MAPENARPRLCAPLLLIAGLAVAACSGTESPRKDPSVSVGESPHAEASKEPRGPLPAALRDQPNGFEPVALADSPNMPPTCSKCPTGVCVTSAKSWCGGVRPPEGWEESRAREVKWWICEAAPPGCPLHPPENGAACSEEGKLCAYGACNRNSARCEGGHWKRSEARPP